MQRKSLIVISASNSLKYLKDFIEKLSKQGFKYFIIVENRSEKKNKQVVFQCENIENANCEILKISACEKKGKNLKIVFEYILKQIEIEKYKNIKKIITIDADGTHDIEDIIKLDNSVQQSTSIITIGARNYKSRKISISDKIGNLMTRNIIKQIYKVKITDTQSRLVVIPIEFLEQFEKVSGGRCEYKTELLLKCLRENIKINEIPIKSLKPIETPVKYKNAILDAIRIYWIFFQTFVKYLGSSLSVALLDFLGFVVFVKILPIQDKFRLVLIATILARIISATTNFFINRKVVFCSADDFGKRAAKFFTVVLFIMVSSGIIVAALSSIINISERIIKIVIDALLFFVSYELQKKWVFKNKDINRKK